MSKVNPLFVDSTKFHGDPIATQIELKKILLYEGEELIVMVTSQQGLSCRAPMTLNEDMGFEARVHLSHQQPITYQFIIEKNGVLILHSRRFGARAQYALIHDWDPEQEKKPAPPIPVVRDSGAWARETSQGLKSLIEKWGL